MASRDLWRRRFVALPAPLVPAGAWLLRMMALVGRGAKGRRRDERWFASAMEQAGCTGNPARVARLHAQTGPLLRLALSSVVTRRDANAARLMTVHGLDHVRAALAGNRGMVLAGSHVGLGALPAAWLVRQGITVHTLRRREQAAHLDGPAAEILFFGTVPIWYAAGDTAAAFLKRGIGCLAQNHVVSYLADGPFGERGVVLPVLGKDVFLRTGSMELARVARAPLVFAFALMDESGHAVVEYLEPRFVETPQDVETAARVFLGHYGERVRRWPWNCTRAHMDRYIFTGDNAEFHAPRRHPAGGP